jgi:hypothetical protein
VTRTGTGPSPDVRALVAVRDGFACACCGMSIIGQVASVQHRKRRSQGGTNCPSNLLLVCGDGTRGCHARIDSRSDPADEAAGYTVRSYDDPAAVPVSYVTGYGSVRKSWLAPDGTLADDAPGRAA